ncbi:hypothetical protein RFI_07528 [Reticulomyxa filosa]|uniref:Transmembrane protein n=1 Tax=Reticulomyxa filosa TaxID=46433 RepID=X6NWE1_RETFI|nr:hypothetical protein RFI_07528 [Reticulomyxa filosa]|eukprot:ETO29592.1 hypothetical protein RFI_07528 [Reticulomyxa filosa]
MHLSLKFVLCSSQSGKSFVHWLKDMAINVGVCCRIVFISLLGFPLCPFAKIQQFSNFLTHKNLKNLYFDYPTSEFAKFSLFYFRYKQAVKLATQKKKKRSNKQEKNTKEQLYTGQQEKLNFFLHNLWCGTLWRCVSFCLIIFFLIDLLLVIFFSPTYNRTTILILVIYLFFFLSEL